MSRANPFGNLDDFAPDPNPKPTSSGAIDRIAQSAGFPSRQVRDHVAAETAVGSVEDEVNARLPRTRRQRTTGRNRQINIKATETVINRLYALADALDLPLGAVLEQALDALAERKGTG